MPTKLIPALASTHSLKRTVHALVAVNCGITSRFAYHASTHLPCCSGQATRNALPEFPPGGDGTRVTMSGVLASVLPPIWKLPPSKSSSTMVVAEAPVPAGSMVPPPAMTVTLEKVAVHNAPVSPLHTTSPTEALAAIAMVAEPALVPLLPAGERYAATT